MPLQSFGRAPDYRTCPTTPTHSPRSAGQFGVWSAKLGQHMTNTDILGGLGWSALFSEQLELDEIGTAMPLRITEVHRSQLIAAGVDGPHEVLVKDSTGDYAVGDWILLDADGKLLRRLDRTTFLARRAAGEAVSLQAIAANVDTLFITTSCNADYNPARLERYLALAGEAEVATLVLLTKADMVQDPAAWEARARELGRDLNIMAIDARDPGLVETLRPWCKPGQTVALLGSSGVGKSTLLNTLTGQDQLTAPIREDDARGRHTTTSRAMFTMAAGGCLIDTPGMRALRLAEAGAGIDATFPEITELLGQCKFRDCAHGAEPGCAIQSAIAAGTLSPERLKRWRKLKEEDGQNTETIAEARARLRKQGKMYRAHAKPK